MSTVRVGETENLESALKRFKRKCARDGDAVLSGSFPLILRLTPC